MPGGGWQSDEKVWIGIDIDALDDLVAAALVNEAKLEADPSLEEPQGWCPWAVSLLGKDPRPAAHWDRYAREVVTHPNVEQSLSQSVDLTED